MLNTTTSSRSTHTFDHPAFAAVPALSRMTGTVVQHPWDGTLFMPHPRHHSALLRRGHEPEAGLWVTDVLLRHLRPIA